MRFPQTNVAAVLVQLTHDAVPGIRPQTKRIILRYRQS